MILTIAAGIVCYLVGAGITLAVIRGLGLESSELLFIMGAILGTHIGALVHHRQAGATNSLGVKAGLGVALALTAVGVGLAAHWAFNLFAYADISIGIAAIGSFVFPFVLFDTMWNALSKAKKKDDYSRASSRGPA